MLRRLAKFGLLVVMGSYLVGCCLPPHGGWGRGGHGERGGYERR